MEFFYIKEQVNITVDKDTNQVLQLLPVSEEQIQSGSIPNNRIYVSTLGCVHNIQNTLIKSNSSILVNCFTQPGKKTILSLPNFPIILSNFDVEKLETLDNPEDRIASTEFIPLEERLKPLIEKKQKSIRVAVVNGMGTGIGDSIVGLQALRAFRLELSKYFTEVTIDLYQTAFNTTNSKRKVYEQECIVNLNELLPMQLDKLQSYDCVADYSTMVLRDNFDTQPMIDYFLENLSIDPTKVNPQAKRNFIKVSEKSINNLNLGLVALKSNNKPLLMLHPSASSPIRSMSPNAVEKLIGFLLKHTDYSILITDSTVCNVNKLKFKIKDLDNRIQDYSYVSNDVEDFIAIISKVDAILTVDTCVYHIADSFSKPTVAMFTTIDPERRVKYYPTVESFVLEPNNKLWGKHLTTQEEDVKYMWNLWNSFDPRVVLNKLEATKEKSKLYLTEFTCPICNHVTISTPSDIYLDNKLFTCEQGCGEFTQSRIAQNYDEMYQTQDYSHYLRERTSNETVDGYMSQIRFKYVKQYLENLSSKGKLLDVGCANGFLVKYTKELGFDSYGIDASSAVIDYSHKTLKLRKKTAVCTDLNELPELFPKKFNIITSFELVEHLEDPLEFASDVFDKLLPGGVWIFSTPNRSRVNFALGLKNTFKHNTFSSGDYPPEHLSRFTSKGHSRLITSAGFKQLFHEATPLISSTIRDNFGLFPKFNVVDKDTNKSLVVDQMAINSAIFGYYQQFTEVIKGYGDFLITIALKPGI